MNLVRWYKENISKHPPPWWKEKKMTNAAFEAPHRDEVGNLHNIGDSQKIQARQVYDAIDGYIERHVKNPAHFIKDTPLNRVVWAWLKCWTVIGWITMVVAIGAAILGSVQ